MQYKIVKAVITVEATAFVPERTEKAAEELETEVQSLIDAGWELAGGAQIEVVRLSHIIMIQTLTKAV